ncbi:MAG: hypothetical protein AAF623_15605 [Planctomycetota bacterium]
MENHKLDIDSMLCDAIPCGHQATISIFASEDRRVEMDWNHHSLELIPIPGLGQIFDATPTMLILGDIRRTRWYQFGWSA